MRLIQVGQGRSHKNQRVPQLFLKFEKREISPPRFFEISQREHCRRHVKRREDWKKPRSSSSISRPEKIFECFHLSRTKGGAHNVYNYIYIYNMSMCIHMSIVIVTVDNK